MIVKKLGFLETIQSILAKDGVGYVLRRPVVSKVLTPFRAFWRGIGPALVLVINPVLQYTVFEQLKNFLVVRRTNKLRAAGAAATAIAVLSDWDFFFLGALSKLGKAKDSLRVVILTDISSVATSSTYPYM